MLMHSRTLFALLFSVLFSIHMGACSSHEAGTEESIQPTEDQAPAEPTEKDKALSEASSSDFSDPNDVQLNSEANPPSTPAEAEAPAVAAVDSETPAPVDNVDNSNTSAPDLTTDISPAVNASVAVYFAKSSSHVTKEYRNQLKELAAKLKTDRSLRVSLSGHCDIRGSAAFNRRLAMKRARAVKAALVKMGVKGKQLTMGTPQLASSGTTEEEHAQNRRVEIEFQ